jgi:hypothetical protein
MGKATRPHDDEGKAPPRGEVSGLLRAWGGGDRKAAIRSIFLFVSRLYVPLVFTAPALSCSAGNGFCRGGRSLRFRVDVC